MKCSDGCLLMTLLSEIIGLNGKAQPDTCEIIETIQVEIRVFDMAKA